MKKNDGTVWGAIYKISTTEKKELDRCEGGYEKGDILVKGRDREEHQCFTYFAKKCRIKDGLKPYHWYKKLVLCGAKYHQFPDEYIKSIEFVQSKEDKCDKRKKKRGRFNQKNLLY